MGIISGQFIEMFLFLKMHDCGDVWYLFRIPIGISDSLSALLRTPYEVNAIIIHIWKRQRVRLRGAENSRVAGATQDHATGAHGLVFYQRAAEEKGLNQNEQPHRNFKRSRSKYTPKCV